MVDLPLLRLDLFSAAQTLSQLHLYHAAKWALEALAGLAATEPPLQPPAMLLIAGPLQDLLPLTLAQSYFGCKEFERAAHVLRDCAGGHAVFLRLYASYLSVDKKAAEDLGGALGVGPSAGLLGGSAPRGGPDDGLDQHKDLADGLSGRLAAIVLEIERFHARPGTAPNAFLLFLQGVIYNRRKRVRLAQDHLLASLQAFAYNWSCWQELAQTFATYDEAAAFVERTRAAAPALAAGVMFQIFEVVLLQEFYQGAAAFHEKIRPLCDVFPSFVFLKVQKFLVAYHGLDYLHAEQLFDAILLQDPMRLDDLDTYLNMLYVMEKKLKLAFLAQYTLQIDRFRAETCCVVANYHLMKGEHDKAVMYYKRALTLNRACLSAWTLMGHEFVELKNSHAAIESYRRAVDINAKDFRAWYGLGQAYEVLDMHLYALYYYQRATSLQPTDKRMWQAIGNCYEKIDKLEEALLSFDKALAIESLSRAGDDAAEPASVEPHICFKLAVISEKLGRTKDSYKYMRICFEQECEWGVTDETSKARLWLARHALENRHFDDAYELAKDFNFSNAHDVEEARAIAKEARNRMGL
ncbi:TPR-like protein [Metschnikowia bicuspidata var. bicuspidata NRRL YB-4993]|uniref:TPR-like protein n=1 Tax=Metschnikowia bicuspidata var. bicuspidata NRRL YB-4993 TaxID=869754 RepID=A0A1A0HDF7_9ASCO|nr:TPR-like protein [Metschnikowia bicuspidata var. bicuspidata NRRL YB-4993]OBA22051.1 TPR-like protein [Metschnikowia bicuspidata var. bicuspidata NRRL YB-4993]